MPSSTPEPASALASPPTAGERRPLEEIETPALILDRGRLDRNIAAMGGHVRRLGVTLRPHLKTAKSADIARRAVPDGGPITVSTLREAEYFAEHGFTDIFYAVAIAPQKLPRVARLMQRGVRVLLAVDHPAAAAALEEGGRRLGVAFEALLEIDSGEGRSGVRPDSPAVDAIAAALEGGGTRLAGVFTHGGHSYSGRTPEQHADVAEQERLAVNRAAGRLRAQGREIGIVSLGSTPSVRHARHLEGVTEVRAGVYMLGDLFQVGIGGTLAPGDIAVSVLATVIGNHPERGQLVVDAGSLALSKDVSTRALGDDRDCGYGLVVDAATGEPIEGLYVHTAFQEHGVIRSRTTLDHARFPIGSRLRILPNHACLTSAAYDRYHVVAEEGGPVEAIWARTNGW